MRLAGAMFDSIGGIAQSIGSFFFAMNQDWVTAYGTTETALGAGKGAGVFVAMWINSYQPSFEFETVVKDPFKYYK